MKKCNRILSMLLPLLLLTMLLWLFAAPVGAADYEGSCGAALSWSFDPENGSLSVSGSGAMEDFTPGGSPWDSFRQDIRRLKVSEGVTSLGANAFRDCSRLQSLDLPESLTAMGDFVFYGCKSLYDVSLPDHIQQLPTSAFGGCVGLIDVDLPSDLKHIGNGAFTACEIMSRMLLPEGVESIGEFSFEGCTMLRTVTMPKSLRSIGRGAFFGCESLTDVTIPAAQSEIGAYCFSFCSSLTNVRIPEGVTAIGTEAFAYCSGLQNIVIPSTVRSIADSAFSDCVSLRTPDLPQGLETIGAYSFYGCTQIKSLQLPDSLTELGEYSFSNCESLSTIYIPKSLMTLGAGAFEGCIGLRTFAVDPENPCFAADEQGALYNETMEQLLQAPCALQDSFVVPQSVRSIADGAFAHSRMTAVSLPEGLTDIGSKAFFHCVDLTVLRLPDTVSRIGGNAFYGCRGLRHVELPEGLTAIPEGLFWHCSALVGVTIPAGVSSLGSYAFCECSSLSALCFRGAAPTVGTEVFFGCTDLTLYYTQGQQGWTSPKWQGSPTKVWDGSPCYAPFPDVVPGSYCADPILWAVEQRITTGATHSSFAPDRACTRAEIVTFLWRAAGCPVPSAGENPFTDVDSGAYYYEAMLWAVEQGITKGTAKDRFSPFKECTRAQVATFLWRAMGCPEAETGEAPFRDLPEDAYYYESVLWAVEQGITKGTGKNSFSPDRSCTRGQIVTFLYRAYVDQNM